MAAAISLMLLISDRISNDVKLSETQVEFLFPGLGETDSDHSFSHDKIKLRDYSFSKLSS